MPGRENILIFRIGHLGDTLVAMPALWSIRAAYPEARLTMLTGVSGSAVSPQNILPAEGLIDEWLVYPQAGGLAGAALEGARLWMALRKGRFDEVFYLMPRARTPAQIRRDVRFFKAAGLSTIRCLEYFRANTITLPGTAPLEETSSEAEFLLAALDSEGIRTQTRHDIATTAAERHYVSEWLASQGIAGSTRLVAIAPGSKWPSKIWPAERYASVVEQLLARCDVHPVVVGGIEDRSVGNDLIHRWGRGINAAGSMSVRESGALLSRCSLFVGNDTGTMHLAAAAGTPCVAIFAAIDMPGRWVPFGERNAIFRTRVPCEGCHSPNCPNGFACLLAIEEEQVLDACLRLLSPVE